jgi:hypothetical protein
VPPSRSFRTSPRIKDFELSYITDEDIVLWRDRRTNGDIEGLVQRGYPPARQRAGAERKHVRARHAEPYIRCPLAQDQADPALVKELAWRVIQPDILLPAERPIPESTQEERAVLQRAREAVIPALDATPCYREPSPITRRGSTISARHFG